MKYIEELVAGDAFAYNNKYFVLTSDYKSNNHKLAYSLDQGFAKWFDPSTIIEKISLYTLDEKNNILPLKEQKKEEYNV